MANSNGITVLLDATGLSVGTVDSLISTINAGSTVESVAGVSQVVASLTGSIPGVGLLTNAVALTMAGVTANPEGATVGQIVTAVGNVVAMASSAMAIAGVGIPALTVVGVVLTVGGAAYNFYEIYNEQSSKSAIDKALSDRTNEATTPPQLPQPSLTPKS